ncbi:MAG: methionyl-tRNA formyltransferase [Candidatus Omnitrophica bacterium]|nr:methionyl-tRNA formyltransferase [Candidatus Omnitrophota bacterium]
MRIVFFGSDDFAAVNLEKLIALKYDVVACVTQPDRPKGRGMKVRVSPIKQLARENNIEVSQPEDIKDNAFQDQLKSFDAGLFVVIAYGKILPAEVLDIPNICAINVHGSLLPKYRGAAPVNWAIIHGDIETGVSVIKMNEKMDAGDILWQERIAIEEEDTSATLRVKMARLSADALLRAIDSLEKGDCVMRVQDENQVSFAPKIMKDFGHIDWTQPAMDIHNLVRGLLPYPAAYTYYNNKRLKVLETCVRKKEDNLQREGEVIEITKEGVVVSCGKGALVLKRVHLESAKPMDAKSFVLGHKMTSGVILG